MVLFVPVRPLSWFYLLLSGQWFLFNGQQFGMAGKTIGSFRRNVLRPLRNMLESEGYSIHDSRSENMLTISKNGHTNYYFIFGGKDEASQDLVKVLLAILL